MTEVGALCRSCGNILPAGKRSWCDEFCQKAGARTAQLMAHFSITDEEYELILLEQDGVCAVCHKPPPEGKRLVVDHDHKTGFVRGLLCQWDNLKTIGKHRESRILRAAADYLDNPPARRALGRDVIAPGRPRRKRKPRRKRVNG